MQTAPMTVEGLRYGPLPWMFDLEMSVANALKINQRSRPTIWLDVDSVLVDFVGGVLDVWFQETGIIVDRMSLTTWSMYDTGHLDKNVISQRIEQKGFCKSLKAFPGAKEAVESLKSIADVYACTSPYTESPYWVDERTVYLEEVFGIDYHHQIHTHAKNLVWADLMVDDRPTNVRKWKDKWQAVFPKPVPNALLWDTPHNRTEDTDDLCRVRSWKDVFFYTSALAGTSTVMN